MKNIFIEAAKDLDSSKTYRGACVSIYSVAEDFYPLGYAWEHTRIFAKYFLPINTGETPHKPGYWLHDYSLTPKQQKNRRVLALLLAYEIDKSGGL